MQHPQVSWLLPWGVPGMSGVPGVPLQMQMHHHHPAHHLQMHHLQPPCGMQHAPVVPVHGMQGMAQGMTGMQGMAQGMQGMGQAMGQGLGPAGLALGMPPAPLAALRTFVATQQQQQHQQTHSQPHHQQQQQQQQQQQVSAAAGVGRVVPRMKVTLNYELSPSSSGSSPQQMCESPGSDYSLASTQKRKADEVEPNKDLKKAKLETKALKAKRPGFTDDRYNETSYYIENGLRKVYPYYFTFTTFTKGRWVGEKILDVFAREFRAHPAEEYERCIKGGTLTVNYEKVDVDYKLKHNDLLANIVHRHEVPVTAEPISIVHMDGDVVVVNKPASIPVHPCGRYRHNTVVFILAKEYNLKNLRTIHRLDRLTSGLLLFGRSPKKARQMEHQIRNRQVAKEYVCRVEGDFPEEEITCSEPIEVVSYKIGVCKVSSRGKECATTFKKLGFNPRTNTSVVLCKPHTGRMHQIRVHLQFLGYPVVNDPLYNHVVFGPNKGKGGLIGKADDELIRDLVNIHNAENWLGMDGDTDLSMFKPLSRDLDEDKGEDDDGEVSREPSPCGSCDDAPVPPCLANNNNSITHNNNISSALPMPVLATAAPTLSSPGSSSSSSSSSGGGGNKVTVATQTGHEVPTLAFQQDKMSHDAHCYECKVRYRDPKPRDLIMYLHAWKFRGPDWSYETELPEWSKVDWCEPDD